MVTKYEEYVEIDEEKNQKEIIKLYDLNQELVLDYYEDEFHIYLRDLATGKEIAKFQYGEEGLSEGYSFTVSPRHNYLIIKEVQEMVSCERLEATIYCLKDIKFETPRRVEDYARLSAPWFNSYTHLSFFFDDRDNERTILLQGQKNGDVELIDVYQFGGVEVNVTSPNVKLAQFYKVTSYPSVQLDTKIRDHIQGTYLRPHTLINSLDKLEPNRFQELKTIDINTNLKEYIQFLKDKCSSTKKLTHVIILDNRFCDFPAKLARELDSHGFDYSVVEHNHSNTNSQLVRHYYVISTPLTEVHDLEVQAISLLNKLAKELDVVYEGFGIKEQSLISEKCMRSNSFRLYKELIQGYLNHKLTIEQLQSNLETLFEKHEVIGINEEFGESKLTTLNTLMSNFNNFDFYEISKDELEKVLIQFINKEES